jgi:hypothetical protein
VKNKSNNAVVCRTLHDVIVEFIRLLSIATELNNKLANVRETAPAGKGKKGKQKKPSRSKKKQPVKLISAKVAQKVLMGMYRSTGMAAPKYVNCHFGSWSAHVTFVRSLSSLAIDAIGVTAGARAWDFVDNMVEVWGRVPTDVQAALDEVVSRLEPGEESLRDTLIHQDHMDKFMSEDKLYGVWNNKGNKLTVSPLHVTVSPCVLCANRCLRACRSRGGRSG